MELMALDQARPNRGGGGADGLELRRLRGAVAEKVAGNVLNHFCWGRLHQFQSGVPLSYTGHFIG